MTLKRSVHLFILLSVQTLHLDTSQLRLGVYKRYRLFFELWDPVPANWNEWWWHFNLSNDGYLLY